MYYCPKCNAKLPVEARCCNFCGFNQTNARLAALSAVPGPGQPPQPPRATAPVSPSQASACIPQAGAYIAPYAEAGVPQLDFAPDVSLPGLPEHPGKQLPETPMPLMPSMQPFQPSLTLTQRYVADQPTTIQPQPLRQPQYAAQQVQFPPVQQTPQPATYYEQAGLTQTGEIRQILRMGLKIHTTSVINKRQQQDTFTKLLPWLIIAIILILIGGTLGLAYLLFSTYR